jgi:uncharacterized protein (TIGR00369 family)
MSIFQKEAEARDLDHLIPPVVRQVGIDHIEVDWQRGELHCQWVVGANNVQPHGVLHGGVSALVAETLCSIGAHLALPEAKSAVGQTLQASHMKAAGQGTVLTARASLTHQGRRSHVWNCDIADDKGRLISRIALTLAVIDMPSSTF